MSLFRLTVCLLTVLASYQQSIEAPAQFEVVSIKPAGPTDRMGDFPTPDTLSIGNRTLRQIMMEVYGVRPYQLAGGPAWIDTEHFNIVGKAPSHHHEPDDEDDASGA